MRKQRRVSKAYYHAKLEKLLRSSRLRDILVMVWCVDAVRNGEPERVKGRLFFPKEVIGGKPGEGHFIAPWMLETLVNEALVHPAATNDSRRILNTKLWQSFALLFDLIREIEDLESLDDIPEMGILDAMARIGWRQFGWQIGYQNAQRFFRAWSLYNFPESNEYFLKTYGISVERFCYVGFAVAAQLTEYPAVRADTTLTDVGIADNERDAFFRIASLSSFDARKFARAERSGKGQMAYKPSVLRRAPMIEIKGDKVIEVFCPIPALLFLRITEGLFYDLIAEDNLKRIIGERFEGYAYEISNYYLGKRFQLLKEEKYGAKSKQRATPDLRIVDTEGRLQVIVECKARRIPFDVLSSPRPYLENKSSYADMVKGVIQIWRYVADVRQKNADANWCLSDDAVGVVLTLEPWFQMSSDTISMIRQRAAEECAQYPNVKEVDQIEIAFVAMSDWEHSIQRGVAENFLLALKNHVSSKKHGFLLSSSVDELKTKEDVEVDPYDYHAGIARFASWWDDVGNGRIPSPSGID